MEIKDYETIFDDLPSLQEEWSSVLLGKKVAYSGGASYAIYNLIPSSKVQLKLSPVMLMKAKKNQVSSFYSEHVFTKNSYLFVIGWI